MFFFSSFILVFFILAFPIKFSKVKQPINFNHKIHIENGLFCTDCHKGALEGISAEIPNIEVCAQCHSSALTEKEEEKKLVFLINKNEEIKWIKVHNLRRDLFFSHRRHTKIAKIECPFCHGEVKEKEKPFTKPFLKFSMNFCLKCHYKNGIKRDCSLCHR